MKTAGPSVWKATDGTIDARRRGLPNLPSPLEEQSSADHRTGQDTLPTIPHVRNFLECIKSREQPNAPVEIGHTAVCGPHLANIAFHTRRAAYLNPEATEVY